MSDNNSRKPNLKNIKKLQLSMIIGYALIVIVSIGIISQLAVKKTDEALKNKVISMVSSLNMQMKLNMESYISRMETIATLSFGVEESYTYDATDPNNDEYEAINKEKIISDKLYSLCIMENFVDYGIVYRNNRTVGKISNGTNSLFGDKIFEELSSMVTRQRTNDGWSTGYKDDFKRIYYVKKIHENAILVISFYASELKSVLDNPETIHGMKIQLTNQDYNILYSIERDEIGTPLQGTISSRAVGQAPATIMDNEYLVSINKCGEEWYIICSIPTSAILKEKNEMQLYIYMTALIAAFFAVLVGTVFSLRLTKPVKNVVTSLDIKAHIDQLTGILNKLSFEEYAQDRISTSLPIEKHALIILDLDNFKGVNDTLGHAYGDIVLAKTGSILRTTFSQNDFVGRIGGDEFCVLINEYPNDVPYEDFVKSKCEQLCTAFRNNYTGDDGKYKISASIGVSLFPEHGSSFAEMYKASDNALYFSKHKGKDTYTIFEDYMKEEVKEK